MQIRSGVFAVYFASFGFLLLSVMGLVRGQELGLCLKRGLAGLAVFWVLGLIFGKIMENIFHDTTPPQSPPQA
jgi:hypothetical protein